MRHFTAAAVLLGLAASAFAAPKPAHKPGAKMTPAQCAAACTKSMKAKGMKGSCPVSACKSGACPMASKTAKPAPKAPAKAKK